MDIYFVIGVVLGSLIASLFWIVYMAFSLSRQWEAYDTLKALFDSMERELREVRSV